jgi:hypothetical protein
LGLLKIEIRKRLEMAIFRNGGALASASSEGADVPIYRRALRNFSVLTQRAWQQLTTKLAPVVLIIAATLAMSVGFAISASAQTGTLRLIVRTSGTENTSTHSFTGTGAVPASFSVTTVASDALNAETITDFTVAAGGAFTTSTAGLVPGNGHVLWFFDCDDASVVPATSGANATLTGAIADGATVTCRMLFRVTRYIDIVKNTVGGDGTFTFNLNHRNTLPDLFIPTSVQVTTAGGTGSATFLTSNTVRISEVATAGYVTTAMTCSVATLFDNLATSTIEPALPTSQAALSPNASCTFTNTFQGGSLQIVKNAVGGDGTFQFTSATAAIGTFSLTTSGGSSSQTFASVTSGVHTITEASIDGWTLSAISCVNAVTVVDLATRSVTVTMTLGVAVVCTFTNTEVSGRTRAIIGGFMKRRADMIVSNGPKGARFVSRLSQRSVNGQANSGNCGDDQNDNNENCQPPMQLGGMAAGTGSNGRMNLSGSWGEATGQRGQFDSWFEGSMTYWNSTDDQGKSRLGLFSAGVDYLVQPGMLVGVMAQYDRSKEDSASLGYLVEGNGWMVGPYAGFRLSDNLFFDSRVLWGRSSNDISPYRTYTDEFQTSRLLFAARLQGRFNYGALTISPSAEIIHFEDKSEAYVDSNGFTIDRVTVRLGRAVFGPEISYVIRQSNGTSITPRIALKGLWDFSSSDVSGLNGTVLSSDSLRGRVEAGLSLRAVSGTQLDLEGSYDGIGNSDVTGYSGTARVRIPLE